jgi:hypothetical protein
MPRPKPDRLASARALLRLSLRNGWRVREAEAERLINSIENER